MKIKDIDILHCDAGWRNYSFVKITADNGLVGWSEFSEGFGSPGVSQVIESLARPLVGDDVPSIEAFHCKAFAKTRPAAGGVISQGIAAIENALLDLKAKQLDVPCYELLGGKVRDDVPVYWSHCGAWRINHPSYYGPQITDLDGMKAIAGEAVERGFSALKTNLFIFDDGPAYAWRPGFSSPYYPELNVDTKLIDNVRAMLGAVRDGAGPNTGLLIDLNFNAKPSGFLTLLRALRDFDLYWVEIDSYNPAALANVRAHADQPISSCETLCGGREFLPFFEAQAVDVAIVDVIWNGAWQAKKIAGLADIYDINIAPHNFYGHVATMISAHLAATTPNLAIMETDVDRLEWDKDIFTGVPEYRNGALELPDAPGWGIDPIEAAIRERPPRHAGGLAMPLKR